MIDNIPVEHQFALSHDEDDFDVEDHDIDDFETLLEDLDDEEYDDQDN